MSDIKIDVTDKYNLGSYEVTIKLGESELKLGLFVGYEADKMARMLYEAAIEMGYEVDE